MDPNDTSTVEEENTDWLPALIWQKTNKETKKF